MTNQHPLTDEILHEKFNGVYHGNLIIFDADDMRAAYDLGRDGRIQTEAGD